MEWLQRSEKGPNHDLITIFYPEITEKKITQVWSRNYGSRCPHKYTRDCPWVELGRHSSPISLLYYFPTLVAISFSILPPMRLQGKIFWERSWNLPVTCIPSLSINNPPPLRTVPTSSLSYKLLAAQSTGHHDTADIQITGDEMGE